jgi:hypothetical protein
MLLKLRSMIARSVGLVSVSLEPDRAELDNQYSNNKEPISPAPGAKLDFSFELAVFA